ncbi:MAG: tetratricopeptide repeat protein [Acidobacteriia bacterium]|nr:tetratricopeptide repeat protein [Terriglobia bacterium]
MPKDRGPARPHLAAVGEVLRIVPRLALAATLALPGCVARPPRASGLAGSSPEAWARALREHGIEPNEVVNPVAWTPEMRDAADRLAGQGSVHQRLKALQDGLFDLSRFPFRYQSRGTYTAIEAFEERKGNCLSFTCLFIALARSIGLDARAAEPAFEGRSERDGDLVVVNTHVVAAYGAGDALTIFDFDRTRERRVVGARMLGDLHLAALYSSNLGVDDLRAGRYDVAIRRFETAVRLSPRFLAAWGNLGVALRRAGDPDGALRAYQEALGIEPHDPAVLGNLAALYRMDGREREARDALAVADVGSASPYLLVVLGDLERARGRPGPALKLYRRAHREARTLADPLIGIAETELERGRLGAARSAARKALAIDPSSADAADVLRRIEGRGSAAP